MTFPARADEIAIFSSRWRAIVCHAEITISLAALLALYGSFPPSGSSSE